MKYVIDLLENVLSLPPGRGFAPGFISLGPSVTNILFVVLEDMKFWCFFMAFLNL